MSAAHMNVADKKSAHVKVAAVIAAGMRVALAERVRRQAPSMLQSLQLPSIRGGFISAQRKRATFDASLFTARKNCKSLSRRVQPIRSQSRPSTPHSALADDHNVNESLPLRHWRCPAVELLPVEARPTEVFNPCQPAAPGT
jgi:hypothetical protein